MISINEKVEHIIFGEGIITEVKDNKIWVKFQEELEVKAFLYPEAFEKYIKALSPEVENNALEELHVKQEQRELERKEREQEIAEQEEKSSKSGTIKKKSAAKSTKKKAEVV